MAFNGQRKYPPMALTRFKEKDLFDCLPLKARISPRQCLINREVGERYKQAVKAQEQAA
jgi:hypothetical protein